MIYLYVGLGMAMLLPIMVGLQVAVSVSELEIQEISFQSENGEIMRRWQEQLDKKTNSKTTAELGVVGYAVRSYGVDGHCVVPDGTAEKCVEEY